MDLDRPELVGAATCGDLHVGGDTDAQEHLVACFAPASLLGAQRLVADRLSRTIEWEVVAARVVGVAGERAEREHVVAEEVALADGDRIDAQLERRLIDQPLEQRCRFGSPCAPVGTHRCGVGDRDRHVELDRGERVRALGHPSRAARQERTDARIRTCVADQSHAQPGEIAVGRATQLGVLDLAAAVGERLHVVTARWHPHHRPPGAATGCGDHAVLGVDAGLAAEPTADLRGDHSDVGGLHPEGGCQLAVQPVRHLRRRPEREAAVVVHLGTATVGLHWNHSHPLVDVAATNDDIGGVQVGARLVDDHHCFVRPVPTEDLDGVGSEGIFGVDVGRQRFDVGPHHLGGVLALLEGFGEHDGDRLADETHLAVCQRRSSEVGMNGREPVVGGHAECVEGEDLDHAGHADGVVGVDLS